MRAYPALTLTWTDAAGDDRADLLLAALDGTGATAIAELPNHALQAFFGSATDRDRAARELSAMDGLTIVAIDVPDEDWGARSQAAIEPVTIGALTVAPPWAVTPEMRARPDRLIVILPSMGFGTGHHATTRLCLEQLQDVPLQGLRVLDVGTGSGVLAIAAAKLGASLAVGIEPDEDARRNAEENLALNGRELQDVVTFREFTLVEATAIDRRFDVILANLTGGHLIRECGHFAHLAAPGARLIASGFQTEESDAVVRALEAAGWTLSTIAADGTWMAGAFELKT